jgi:hypothetical protein
MTTEFNPHGFNHSFPRVYEAEQGKYVEYEDYAILKAEVERLTERLGGVRLIVTEEMYDELNTKYLEQQHELQNIALTARQILDEKIDLKDKVERLTKAGDEMDAYLKRQDGTTNGMLDCRHQWNAAKEGKPQP